jgi:hypothetical protein
MTDPSKFDDDWAELARELERDKPSTPLPRSEQTPHLEIEEENETASISEAFIEDRAEPNEAASTEEFDDAVESGAIGEGESGDDSTAADGQPGTGRKRRRRRRRRKKGAAGAAQPTDAGSSEDMEHDKEDGEERGSEESRTSAVPATGRGEYDDESDDFSDEPTPLSTPEDLEDDAGGELLRELIANWNVPSWDEVVSGLYRPDR